MLEAFVGRRLRAFADPICKLDRITIDETSFPMDMQRHLGLLDTYRLRHPSSAPSGTDFSCCVCFNQLMDVYVREENNKQTEKGKDKNMKKQMRKQKGRNLLMTFEKILLFWFDFGFLICKWFIEGFDVANESYQLPRDQKRKKICVYILCGRTKHWERENEKRTGRLRISEGNFCKVTECSCT